MSNPRAYVRADGTPAFPNLYDADRLARELRVAEYWGLRPVRVAPTPDGRPDPAVVRRLAQEFGGKDAIYVVTADRVMHVIPAAVGDWQTYHTMASAGAEVLAAGHLTVGPDGHVAGWDNASGHYRPAPGACVDVVLEVLDAAGLL